MPRRSGAMLNVLWGAPFLGLLLSIAVLPAVAPRFWERQMGWVALAWCALLLIPLWVFVGRDEAWKTAWHALVVEYVPFVTLLAALYTVSGGILLRGGPAGTPMGNTVLLMLGMALGLVMGPTGAAMVTIQALLRANAHRRRKMHLVVFLIVLVANASGALTPLGNPPLFVGLLRGVPFFWPARHLALPYAAVVGILLAAFYGLDRWLARSEAPPPPRRPLQVRGWGNVALIALLAASVLAQGVPLPQITLFGQAIGTGRLAGVVVPAGAIALSLWMTPRAVRQANDFAWHPMIEVAVLFAGIFVTLVPVSEMLRLGPDGPMAQLFTLTQDGTGQPRIFVYFWLTGLLSAFLDNAPAYLVFFDLAGIRPDAMTAAQESALRAISAGAVFFGGLTYIGNAPNLMLRTLAAHRGVRMPGFFGFFFLAAALLLPVFLLLSVLFFA